MTFTNQYQQLQQICQLEVQLKNGTLKDSFFINELITGELVLCPKKSFRVHSFGYQLISEARGKVKHYSRVLASKLLLKHSRFEKDKEYRFPLRIINKGFETYKGINTNFLVKIEFFVKLEEDHSRKKDLRSRINDLFPTENIYKEKHYLTFTSKSDAYTIQSKEDQLRIDYDNIFQILLIIGTILVFGFAIGQPNVNYLLIGLPILAVLYGFYYLYLENLIGALKIEYENLSNKQFSVKLSHEKRWKNIKALWINYEIQEEVVDQRGTALTTLIQTIHSSKVQPAKRPTHQVIKTYDFPNGILGSTQIEDSQIYWLMKVRVKTIWGFQVSYTSTFQVKK